MRTLAVAGLIALAACGGGSSKAKEAIPWRDGAQLDAGLAEAKRRNVSVMVYFTMDG